MKKNSPLFLIPILMFFAALAHGAPLLARAEEKPPLPAREGHEISGWEARWELARILSYAKRYDESVKEYKRLLAEKPELYEAKAELAKVLFWQGKGGESLARLEQIPAARIDDNTRIIMADLYTARKDYGKATPLYRAYLTRHPDDLKTRLKLAEALSWNKEYDASIAEYRIILDKSPDDIQVRRKYAFVLIWAGKHSAAAEELRKTLK